MILFGWVEGRLRQRVQIERNGGIRARLLRKRRALD
jgi:hypothetical protein